MNSAIICAEEATAQVKGKGNEKAAVKNTLSF
jgi:hypothetical protein